MPLRARKSDINRFCDSWESDNFREKKKQRTDTKKDAKKIQSDNFTRSNMEKIFGWLYNNFVFWWQQ